jgi:hypothetical protein
MKNEITLDSILDSKEFNSMFNIELEIQEINQAGWSYNELNYFGKQLAKKIK